MFFHHSLPLECREGVLLRQLPQFRDRVSVLDHAAHAGL
jgi:hypothetical protein